MKALSALLAFDEYMHDPGKYSRLRQDAVEVEAGGTWLALLASSSPSHGGLAGGSDGEGPSDGGDDGRRNTPGEHGAAQRESGAHGADRFIPLREVP